MESHLLQMRGLKQLTKAQAEYTEKVASFTDAWIETNDPNDFYEKHMVASFTDAWIETHIYIIICLP